MCGDVEANPGPTGAQLRPAGQTGRLTRQSTLNSLSFTQPASSGNRRTSGANENPIQNPGQNEMFEFLRTMKQELTQQNTQVRNDVASMNTKIDSITNSMKDLKHENEKLRQSNIELSSQVRSLNLKVDNLEAHSRRNNLRISGIEGEQSEPWDTTERKVRNFMRKRLFFGLYIFMWGEGVNYAKIVPCRL